MTKPAVWSLEHLTAQDLGRVVVWATPSARARVQAELPWPQRDPAAGLPTDADTLVVVGGGTLIDSAKAQRRDFAPQLRLVAVPSIWGSGAEASPIVVVNHDDRKEIRKGDEFLPDARVVWPELATDVPSSLARYGCGDTWAHALEGFLSPLAGETLRQQLAGLIEELLALPLGADARWFDASARACAAQARSSVGLVHGIAHVLEPALRASQPAYGWGHARLCTVFLWPVLALAQSTSSKARDLAKRFQVDLEATTAHARALFDQRDYDAAVPTLEALWGRVLRDPSTRTNCVLVRGEHLTFFAQRAFQ
jgi:alcohol dehydrogenase class IV